jgi:hypothetical protein
MEGSQFINDLGGTWKFLEFVPANCSTNVPD